LANHTQAMATRCPLGARFSTISGRCFPAALLGTNPVKYRELKFQVWLSFKQPVENYGKTFFSLVLCDF